MPDLDATVEVGPVLVFTLARDRRIDYNYRLQLRLPARAAIATDLSHWHNIGWVFYPHLNLDVRPEFLGGRWNMGFSAGPLYATQKFHQYFYGVPRSSPRPSVPRTRRAAAIPARRSSPAISRRIEKFWVGAYVRYDNLSGAVFDPSPLVKQNYAVAAGMAFAWVFAESGTKVQTPD